MTVIHQQELRASELQFNGGMMEVYGCAYQL
jgi:hypothetical protein